MYRPGTQILGAQLSPVPRIKTLLHKGKKKKKKNKINKKRRKGKGKKKERGTERKVENLGKDRMGL